MNKDEEYYIKVLGMLEEEDFSRETVIEAINVIMKNYSELKKRYAEELEKNSFFKKAECYVMGGRQNGKTAEMEHIIGKIYVPKDRLEELNDKIEEVEEKLDKHIDYHVAEYKKKINREKDKLEMLKFLQKEKEKNLEVLRNKGVFI